jgi:hypothetical protein
MPPGQVHIIPVQNGTLFRGPVLIRTGLPGANSNHGSDGEQPSAPRLVQRQLIQTARLSAGTPVLELM